MLSPERKVLTAFAMLAMFNIAAGASTGTDISEQPSIPRHITQDNSPKPEDTAATSVPDNPPAVETVSTPENEADPLESALFEQKHEPDDERVLAIWQAYQAHDLDTLRARAQALPNHALSAYFELWILNLELQANPDDVALNLRYQAFIDAHQGEYLGERAATDYLYTVSKRINRFLFNQIYNRLVWNKTDETLFAWNLVYNHDTISVSQAKDFFLQTRSSGAPLEALSALLAKADPAWSWAQVRILLQKNQRKTLEKILPNLAPEQLPVPVDVLQSILQNPVGWFNRHHDALNSIGPETGFFLALCLAHRQTGMAAEVAQSIEKQLSSNDRNILWATIGYEDSVNLSPEASLWYRKTNKNLADIPLLVRKKEIIGWGIRAYLRQQDWAGVERLTRKMPAAMQKDDCWIYWRGRALKAMGRTTEAKALFTSINTGLSFYSKLACDELNQPYRFQNIATDKSALNPEHLTIWDDNQSIRRAQIFYRLDLFWQGHREWNWAMRGLSASEYLGLAAYARDKQLIHRMINTSQRSGQNLIDIAQRYPMPHRRQVEEIAAGQNIPLEWVYGLIRQESRFMPAVSSTVGARGLMQIMPSTARWLAKKLNLSEYRLNRLTELDTNLLLGSAYMSMLKSDFSDSFVLATAAYNAGPARARIWRATLDKPMEAAIFIETIPFHETRNYVKNVMANTQTYGMRLHTNTLRFQNILGTVRPFSGQYAELP